MTDATRKQLHDLLDRVLDDEDYPWFWFSGGPCHRIKVRINGVEFEEKRGAGVFGRAVTRAAEATA